MKTDKKSAVKKLSEDNFHLFIYFLIKCGVFLTEALEACVKLGCYVKPDLVIV